MVTHHAKEPVGVEVHRPLVTVLAASHHNVVRDAQDRVDGIWMTRKLIAVQPALILSVERTE